MELAFPLLLALCAAAMANSKVNGASACTGASSSLEDAQCAAFQNLFDGIGGTGLTNCSDSKLDPCSCGGVDCPPGGDHSACVRCKHGSITALYVNRCTASDQHFFSFLPTPHLSRSFIDVGLNGTISDSIGKLTGLTWL
jgi:hypothetical protein